MLKDDENEEEVKEKDHESAQIKEEPPIPQTQPDPAFE